MLDIDPTKAKLAEWIFRLLVIIGLLYLSSNYVSLKDYKSDEAFKAKSLNEISVTLGRIDERSKYDDTRDRLKTLEQKVSALERKIP
jgi:hypothetical protein